MAFRFQDTTIGGSPLRYGWVEMTADVTDTTGPSVTIHDWAYESTGQFIGMGVGVPEPAESTAAVAGALLLGAAGLRTWRKRKRLAGT